MSSNNNGFESGKFVFYFHYKSDNNIVFEYLPTLVNNLLVTDLLTLHADRLPVNLCQSNIKIH